MLKFKKIYILCFIGVLLLACKQSDSNLKTLTLKEQLVSLFPEAKIDTVKVRDHFSEAYQLVLKQPLDHSNPEKGYFDHYIYLSHTNHDSPNVFITEGYNANHKTYELSKLFKANQIMVEYRFYGKSRPDSIPWQYLKNDEAVEDYHAIISKLKKIYNNKWISTGISKGGETVLIYKSIYPEDIDVAVPYVAPLINTQEDPRTNALINSVGNLECREKIKKFQRAVLLKRDSILVSLSNNSKENNVLFTKMPIEEALEHSVLEFPFSFWQWGSKCDEIPDESANSQDLFNYLNKVSGFYLFSDAGIHNYLPSFYQHMTELGYYGYDLNPVEDLLTHIKTSSLACFGPNDIDLTYNPNYINKVRHFVENKGNNILYIYGEYDPWGACAPNPNQNVDALKMTLKEGHHGTRIKDFSDEDKQTIYNKLNDWLGGEVKLFPLEE